MKSIFSMNNSKLESEKPSFRIDKGRFVALLTVALLIYAALFLMVVYEHSRLENVRANLTQFTSDPTAAANVENKQLLGKVGQLIVLPADEQPTIATVTDLSKLKDQPFFANAAVGDKVLIYTNAKKAVLYRPSENKIIEVAPLNLGAQPDATPAKK